MKVVVVVALASLLGCRTPDRYHIFGGTQTGSDSVFTDGRKGFETEESYFLALGVSGSLIGPASKSRVPEPQYQQERAHQHQEAAGKGDTDDALETPSVVGGPVVTDEEDHWWENETFLAWLKSVLILVIGVVAGRGGPKAWAQLERKVRRRGEDLPSPPP